MNENIEINNNDTISTLIDNKYSEYYLNEALGKFRDMYYKKGFLTGYLWGVSSVFILYYFLNFIEYFIFK